MLASDDPHLNQLRVLRSAEAKRLAGLTRRLEEIDGVLTPRAFDAVQALVADCASRLAELDEQLAGARFEVVEARTQRPVVAVMPKRRRTADAPALTVAEAKAASRARLHMVLLALSGLPEGCAEAAANLRRAINLELRRLDKLKAVERRQHVGGGSHAAE